MPLSLDHGCRHARQVRNQMNNDRCRIAPLSTFILAGVGHWVYRAVLGDAMVGLTIRFSQFAFGVARCMRQLAVLRGQSLTKDAVSMLFCELVLLEMWTFSWYVSFGVHCVHALPREA